MNGKREDISELDIKVASGVGSEDVPKSKTGNDLVVFFIQSPFQER